MTRCQASFQMDEAAEELVSFVDEETMRTELPSINLDLSNFVLKSSLTQGISARREF